MKPQIRFGSKLADTWAGVLLTFLSGAVLIWLGYILGQREPWFIVASFLIVFIAGITAAVLNGKKYPSLRTGVLIGLVLALLNPLSIALAFITIVTLASPSG